MVATPCRFHPIRDGASSARRKRSPPCVARAKHTSRSLRIESVAFSDQEMKNALEVAAAIPI
eukprot:7397965-Pyramimonas_sp.AAC.2